MRYRGAVGKGSGYLRAIAREKKAVRRGGGAEEGVKREG
jgi:hypothetical protein